MIFNANRTLIIISLSLGLALVLTARKYLRAVSTSANPSESEIIINVPLALKIMTTGYIWPISAWQELISNDLVAVSEEITVSPR